MPAAKVLTTLVWRGRIGFTLASQNLRAWARPRHGVCHESRAEAGWFGVVEERSKRFWIFPRTRFSIPKVPNIGTASVRKTRRNTGFLVSGCSKNRWILEYIRGSGGGQRYQAQMLAVGSQPELSSVGSRRSPMARVVRALLQVVSANGLALGDFCVLHSGVCASTISKLLRR